MWMLIYIIISGLEPVAINAEGPNVTFKTINECFQKREELVTALGKDGFFPAGSQEICVRMKDESR